MALLVNWLDAIGALVIFGLFYNNAPLLHPTEAAFVSLTALVFIALSYVMRANSVKMIRLDNTAALAGLVLVLTVVGWGLYFAIPQVSAFTATAQYVVFGWLMLLNVLVVGESLLAFKNRKHPKLEDKVHQLEAEEHRKAS